MLEVWGQHGGQDGCPHFLSEQLVVFSKQCQDLGPPLVDVDRDLLESFALLGLMAAVMSCLPFIGVVGLYLLESFLSNPLNRLVCSIWKGSPLTKIPRMLKIPELRDLSSTDSDKSSSTLFLLLGGFNQVVRCFVGRLGR